MSLRLTAWPLAVLVSLAACSTEPKATAPEVSAVPASTPSVLPAPIASNESDADTLGLVEDDYLERAREMVTAENLEAELDALEAEIGEPD